jgi:hypothetical protein
MVHGLDIFKKYFEAYKDQYVFIGGTACDIMMNDIGLPFRATKDLDIVLVIEDLNISFGKRLWEFIEDAGYDYRSKSNDRAKFYRFHKPKDTTLPFMIELFSRKSQAFEMKVESGLTPIHIDDSISSLSAILLDNNYYEELLKGKQIVDGLSVVDIETIILFKIKAWLDLTLRYRFDNSVSSRDIKKHKNDVFRLLIGANPSKSLKLNGKTLLDVSKFIDQAENDPPDLHNIGIENIGFKELIDLLRKLMES